MNLGQMSLEHIILVGIALGLLVPAVYFFYAYSQQNQITTVSNQISNIGTEMVSAVKGTYALGRNARKTVTVGFPDGVRRVYISDMTELIIEYETRAGVTNGVFYSHVNMTSPEENITAGYPGVVTFRFVSAGGNVSIEAVQ